MKKACQPIGNIEKNVCRHRTPRPASATWRIRTSSRAEMTEPRLALRKRRIVRPVTSGHADQGNSYRQREAETEWCHELCQGRAPAGAVVAARNDFARHYHIIRRCDTSGLAVAELAHCVTEQDKEQNHAACRARPSRRSRNEVTSVASRASLRSLPGGQST
jgi:hypothetical protein